MLEKHIIGTRTRTPTNVRVGCVLGLFVNHDPLLHVLHLPKQDTKSKSEGSCVAQQHGLDLDLALGGIESEQEFSARKFPINARGDFCRWEAAWPCGMT